MTETTPSNAAIRYAWEDVCDAYEAHVLANGGNHVAVPKANATLSKWVANQRNHYKLFVSGKPTFLNEARINKLNSIGFAWTVHMSWTGRYLELEQHFHKHGNVSVSRHNKETKGLGEWLEETNQHFVYGSSM
jgi:Helicase associated domain.